MILNSKPLTLNNLVSWAIFCFEIQHYHIISAISAGKVPSHTHTQERRTQAIADTVSGQRCEPHAKQYGFSICVTLLPHGLLEGYYTSFLDLIIARVAFHDTRLLLTATREKSQRALREFFLSLLLFLTSLVRVSSHFFLSITRSLALSRFVCPFHTLHWQVFSACIQYIWAATLLRHFSQL